MRRKLILTPYEHGYLAGFRQRLFDDTNNPIDIPHILFASMTMAGVDYIETMGKIQNSETKLIKKIASKATHRKWNECHNRIESAFNKYITEKTSKESKEEINGLFYKILYLLFAMETKSGGLVFSGLDKFAGKNLLPLELNSTAQILFHLFNQKPQIYLL